MPIAVTVLLLAAAWRVFILYVPELSNFAPVMALAFCAGVYSKNRWLWAAPFAALVVSDLYIDYHYAAVYRYEWTLGGEAIRIACFAAGLGIGILASRRRSWSGLLAGVLGSSVLFYLVTNTASWAGDFAYPRGLAGWWQAVTVGHPQYLPTLFFFRNSLVSDLLFTGLFAVMMEYALRRRGSPSLVGLKQVGR
ncbi:MAG TPA: DUF6580 family putative transport protein [Opitutaceae bacterium]|jgi:hypothetical protein